MAAETHDFDLAGLRLSAGEGRRLDARRADRAAASWAASATRPRRRRVPVELEVSRMIGGGYALRLRFRPPLEGPCMRCLKEAEPSVEVESREVDRPGGGEELDSPYVREETLDLAAWARDAFALAVPGEGALPRGLRRAVSGVRGGPERGWSRAPPCSPRPIGAGRSCASSSSSSERAGW